MRATHLPLGLTMSLALILMGGCPAGITIQLPDGGGVTIPLSGLGSRVVFVEVWNDTDYEVAPRVRFDDATGFWERLVSSSSELNTGILYSGDLPAPFQLSCDEVGVIYSESAGQFFLNATIGQADDTRVLERGEDFDCGDTIRFHFIGNGDGFGVNVYVNGVLVD